MCSCTYCFELDFWNLTALYGRAQFWVELYMTENEKQNIDLTGAKWTLAPGGREIIDKCQTASWDTGLELLAISALLRNMSNSDIDADEFYGLSLILQRLGKRLRKTSETVLKSVSSE